MDFQQLLGFAPDADPTTPGVMVDCDALIPTRKGFAALPGFVKAESASCSVFPNATVVGAEVGVWAGREVFLAATSDRVYALQHVAPTATGTSWANWVNVSAPGDTTMIGPRVFEQFGDYIISAHGDGGQADARTVQAYYLASGSNTAFASISAAPVAAIVVTAARFVVALCTYADGYWDGWHCCARDNHTDWALSVATLCAKGRLVDTAGPVTAGIAVDDDVLAFKRDAFYRGRFVGAPEVWQWDKQPFIAGCISSLAVTKDAEGIVYFLGTEDLYGFDGAVCKPLMSGAIRKWYADNCSPFLLSRSSVAVRYDQMRGLVWLELRDSTAGRLYLLAYEPASGRWTKTTINSLTDYSGLHATPVQTIGAIGSSALNPSQMSVGLFNSTGSLRVLAGSYVSATGVPLPSFTTGDFGDLAADTQLTAARIKFTIAPASSTCTGLHRSNLDASLTTATPVARTSTEGKYELWQNDRWHRLKFDFSGDCEFSGFAVGGDGVDVR